MKKYEEQILTEGIQQLASESDAFQFLYEEEDLYSIDDLKVHFNDKRWHHTYSFQAKESE
jgi:uncharacterized protein YneR